MNKILYTILVFTAVIFGGLTWVNCSKSTVSDNPDEVVDGGWDDTTGGTVLSSISGWSLSDPFELPFQDYLNLPFSGINEGDVITLTLREDDTQCYTLTCTSTSDSTGAYFSVPEHFIGGMCCVTATLGGVGFNEEVFVSVVDDFVPPTKAGRTTCGRVIDWDGNPVAGVSVSDGKLVTATDDDGLYYLSSTRPNGYVFISVPGNYRVAVNRTIPQFYQNFSSSNTSDYEIHNFILEPEDNEKHRIIVFTDNHLANRTNDKSQFENLKTDFRELVAEAKSEGVKLYALALGDLTWDEYWYDNSYDLESYYETMSDMDMAIYNIPGNHDNDPYIADDFSSEAAFRKWIGPTYFSFNIGSIHYVMMDNTLFYNSGASQGVIGDVQDYEEGYTENQLKWLSADLANVPSGSTVFFCGHIQYSNRTKLQDDGTYSFSYSVPATYRAELIDEFEPFDVHICTGHTHVNYTNRISDNLMEHNIAATCATWWWTGYYTSNRAHMCRDGSPGGYKIFDIEENGDLTWVYKGTNRNKSYQFRAYDLNNCLISRNVYCPASSSGKVSDDFFSEYVYGYDTARSDNHILVNVFDYDDDWTVEMTENGKALTVSRTDAYDPLHIIHFNTKRMASNSTSMTFPTLMTAHMFEATASSATSDIVITVTDPWGNKYTETMSRPRYLYDMSLASIY